MPVVLMLGREKYLLSVVATSQCRWRSVCGVNRLPLMIWLSRLSSFSHEYCIDGAADEDDRLTCLIVNGTIVVCDGRVEEGVLPGKAIRATVRRSRP
jgi:hypothetical protein